jgi:hypothetical protein
MVEAPVTRWLTALLALLSALGAAPSRAADPAVAQPSFPIDGEIQTKGIVFFVPADTPSGAAAIGTAHTFDLTKLVRVRRGDFILGRSRRVVARATGFLVPPGRPFNAPGAGLPDDYVVYALDSKPAGVRLLALEPSDKVRTGTRVQLLGVPSAIPHDEDDLFGRVAKASPDRIEVDLDVPYNLRGWGGAPVLDEGSHRVIGMLQAYFARGSTSRVIVSPIAKVRAALADPLEGGKGRTFAAFQDSVKDPSRERKAAAKRQRSAGSRGSADGSYAKRPPQPLIKQEYKEGTRVYLDIEYPPNEAVVGDSACGVFVSGRALALHGELRRFDVVLVIDTSRSTVEPTGADINGNGIVGRAYLGRIGSIFSAASTDPGDSILSAEVAAARQLLHGLDPRSTRVGVVSFAGELPEGQGGLFMRGPRPPAVTLEPLTEDYARVERALDSIAARDPAGSTHMAAGVDQATVELMGLRGALSKNDPRSEKIVLFFTDGQPTLPYGPGFEADNVRAVLRAANRAQRANIRIHSFAIGPDALEGPVATVEMAARTDGFFTPVRHPGDLVNVVEEVSFANLEGVTLKSLTTGEPAEDFRITADGSWAGFIRMEPGEHEVELRARASDGTEAAEKIRVTLAKDAPDPPVPSENCLRSIKQVRMSVEQERAEQIRKELLVEIERERHEARARAEEQRKRLKLEVEEEEPPSQ